MTRLAHVVAAAALAFCAARTALAADVGGVKLDDKLSLGGQELTLNGAGIRSRVVFKVYVASLYLPQQANDLPGVLSKGPRRIQMNMLRTLSADQFVDALHEGLSANNSAVELSAVKTQVDQLASIMKAFKEVKEGDVVALDFVEGGTRVMLNAEAKGTITGEAFNQALIKIWLGDKPVQADLKKALLGG